MSEPLFEACHLNLHFGGVYAVHDVSFTVDAGEVWLGDRQVEVLY